MRLLPYASLMLSIALFLSPVLASSSTLPLNSSKDSPLGPIEGIGSYTLVTPELPNEVPEEFSVDFHINGNHYPIDFHIFY